MTSDIFDLTIIGGGPIGLFAAGVAGETGARCYIIESRLHLGGIMMSTYPDKDVYNFPGVQLIKGRDLVSDLIQKARAFGMVPCLGQYVTQIVKGSKNTIIVKTDKNEFISSMVIIASGLKAYYSPLTDFIKIDDWNGSNIYENWPKAETIRNKKVAIILESTAKLPIPEEYNSVKSDLFWILGKSESVWDKTLGDKPKGEIIKKPWIIKNVMGHKTPRGILFINEQTGEERLIEIDSIIALYDIQPRQTLYSNLGIETLGGQIKVDPSMKTSLKRIYAIGDIAYYPGKIKLLSTGIYEARIAVKNALKSA